MRENVWEEIEKFVEILKTFCGEGQNLKKFEKKMLKVVIRNFENLKIEKLLRSVLKSLWMHPKERN